MSTKVAQFVKKAQIKSYDPEHVCFAILAISEVFYSDTRLVMEPDCCPWVQEDNHDHQLFEERCDALMYSTFADPRVSWTHLIKLSLADRVRVLEEIIRYRAMAEIMAWPLTDKKIIAWWEKFFELEPGESGFDSVDEIVHHCCTNSTIINIGIDIANEANSAELNEWFDVDREFCEFLKEQDRGWTLCGGAIDTDNVNRRVIEGGGGRMIDGQASEDQEDWDVGMIYLCPWPGIRVLEDSSGKFTDVANLFNSVQRQKWFNRMNGR